MILNHNTDALMTQMGVNGTEQCKKHSQVIFDGKSQFRTSIKTNSTKPKHCTCKYILLYETSKYSYCKIITLRAN